MGRAAGAGMLVCLAVATPAHAQVTQPDAEQTVVPLPVPEAEIVVVTGRGFDASAITLEGLFAERGDAIGAADALAAPGTFVPRCDAGELSVELVLRGANCLLPLAWYNVGALPGDDQLFEVVPANVVELMECVDTTYCPLASHETTQPGQHEWIEMTFAVDDLCADQRYAGGAIAFALLGNTNSLCSQTKYSERSLNVNCAACSPSEPWVTVLIYPSSVPDSYYLAFEDLPMSATSWRGDGGLAWFDVVDTS